jgi:recombination protein RecA
MPRAKSPATKKRTAKKKGATTGVMALARAAAAKAGNLPEKDWRVSLDPNALTESLPHLPTGSLIIDFLIGGELNAQGVRPCPGLPRGRVSQIWGHESAGKTTLALTAAATVCANGGTVLYIDWENDIVPDYASALGVPITDPDRFELAQPQTLEDGVKLAMIYAAAGVDLIVFDSVGAAVPRRIAMRELADVGEQSRVGELQAVWSQELPNLKRVISRKGGHILGISQIRAKINTGPSRGGPTTQPQGGNAWKFYASVRLELRRIKQEKAKLFNVLTHKTDDRIMGGIINCKVVKCKLSSSQGREELFYIRWGEGIDDVRSVLEIGAAHGVIKKAGSWLSASFVSGEFKCQGTNKMRDHLIKTPVDFNALYNKVIPLLGQRTFQEEDMEDLSDVDGLLAEIENPRAAAEAEGLIDAVVE